MGRCKKSAVRAIGELTYDDNVARLKAALAEPVQPGDLDWIDALPELPPLPDHPGQVVAMLLPRVPKVKQRGSKKGR